MRVTNLVFSTFDKGQQSPEFALQPGLSPHNAQDPAQLRLVSPQAPAKIRCAIRTCGMW